MFKYVYNWLYLSLTFQNKKQLISVILGNVRCCQMNLSKHREIERERL